VRVESGAFRQHQYDVLYGSGENSPYWAKRIFRAEHPNFRADPALMEQDRLLSERMEYGKGWDYPDELYNFPLGLVVQAHNELGRTK